MNVLVYNLSLIAGTLLVSVGVGLISLPYGLVTGGTLVVGLTIFNTIHFDDRGGPR